MYPLYQNKDDAKTISTCNAIKKKKFEIFNTVKTNKQTTSLFHISVDWPGKHNQTKISRITIIQSQMQ